MKRIGILTFHAAHNYGAVLQCYALQEFLHSKGHEVEIIDYRLPSIVNGYHWFKLNRFISKNPYKLLKKTIYELHLIKKRKQRYDAFETFINERLNLAPIEKIFDNPYDIIIIGSDQVWNYNLTNGFDHYYWGNFPHPPQTKIISYAASMHDNWPNSYDDIIVKKLKKLDFISVRELSLAKKLSKLLPNKEIHSVIDPTLLIKKEQWDNIAKRPKINYPYLLLYQVERDTKSEYIAEKIAKRKNLKIVYLSAHVSDINTNKVIASSPEEFIGLFKYAEFIVCSSFHGTIFSLQFAKPFVSVKMGLGKDSRVGNLLRDLNLKDLFISNYNEINDKTLDSVILNERINHLRIKTIKLLEKFL